MNPRQLAALLFLAAVWGASFLFIRVAATVLGPFPLMAGRVLIAAGALWLIACARRMPIALRPYWRQLLVLGLVHAAAPFALIAIAEIRLTASMAAVLIAAQPLLVLLSLVLVNNVPLWAPLARRRVALSWKTPNSEFEHTAQPAELEGASGCQG